ncbi:MAG: hypothetical protein PHN56_07205 [Candidatus Nanoarchaeia archaeon]|nr:hypothetical protein [Candidatus Nanoarchaeia archaeon]
MKKYYFFRLKGGHIPHIYQTKDKFINSFNRVKDRVRQMGYCNGKSWVYSEGNELNKFINFLNKNNGKKESCKESKKN